MNTAKETQENHCIYVHISTAFLPDYICLLRTEGTCIAVSSYQSSLCNNILLALLKVTKSTEKLWLMWVTLETLASINIQKRQKASHFCYLEQYNKILPCWRLLNSFVLTVCFGYYSNIYMHFEGVNITNG